MEAKTVLRILAFSLLSVTKLESGARNVGMDDLFLVSALNNIGFWIGSVSAFRKSLLGFPDLFSNAISGKLILGEFVVIACSFIGFE